MGPTVAFAVNALQTTSAIPHFLQLPLPLDWSQRLSPKDFLIQIISEAKCQGTQPATDGTRSGPSISEMGFWSWLSHQMAGNEDPVPGDGGIDSPWHEAEVQLRVAERNAQEKPKNQGNSLPPGYGIGRCCWGQLTQQRKTSKA